MRPKKSERVRRKEKHEAEKLLLGWDAEHLSQARADVDQARKLVASAIVQVGHASVSSVSPKERISQRALRAAMEALHTATCVLENEHDSAVSRARKATP